MRKLILIGSLLTWTAFCFAQSGTLDPTFGNQGIVTTDMGSAFNYADAGDQVLTQPDGSMYLVSHSAGLLRISKKHPDGSTDLSYGKNGYSISAPVYLSSYHSGRIAALQSDGKIVAVGFSPNPGQYDNSSNFAVSRFNTNGSLDSTFGSNGIQVTDFYESDYATAVAIQSDGKIIAVGYTDGIYGTGIALARYNTDGSLDDTFSGDGMQIFSKAIFDPHYAGSVAIQNDGKIVVAGNVLLRCDSTGNLDSTFNGDGIQLIPGTASAVAIQSNGKIVVAGDELLRYDSTGSMDSSFNGDGIQLITGTANAVAIQSNGKILAAGSTTGSGSNNDFAVARYNTDGSPDTSFSVDGVQTTDFNSADDHVNSIAIQSDGRIVALGYTANGANSYIAAARYDTSGNPDNSFDGDGTLTEHITQGSTFYTCTAIQSDGKVLAAGYTWNGSKYDFALARYNTNGSLDSTFSGDGKQTADFDSLDDKANAIVIQSDGKIVVAGSAGNNFGVARFNTDGSPDLSFDGDGIKTDLGAPGAVSSLGLFSDGKILAAGTSLARYNTNGSPDISFGVNGQVAINCNAAAIQSDDKIIITNFDNVVRYNSDGSVDNTFLLWPPIFPGLGDYDYWNPTCIAVQNDGKIVIGGTFGNGYRAVTSYFTLWRLNTDGTSDSTFNSDGTVTWRFGGHGTSVVTQNDNKIILGGYSYNGSSNNFALQRVNTDGSMDNTFGSGGIVITGASAADNAIAGMAISNDKLYAAGYGQYPGNFGVVARYFLAEGGPLPVSLLDFTGVLQNKAVLLQWKIATAKNLTSFVVERSGNGSSFLPINTVTATGVSTGTRDYSIVDKQPWQGINFYRLKMVDADGKFTYSNIVAVRINSINNLQIFPNPAAKILFVEADGNNENAIVQIVDADGRKLKEMKVSLNSGTSFSIDISNLANGIYNLVLHKNEKIEVQRFIKR